MKILKNIQMYPSMAFFSVLLILFSVFDFIKPDKGFSYLENRYLAQKPSWSVEKIINGNFSQEYETYINEQFFARDYWINLKSIIESTFNKIENNGIVYGKDNYLFQKYIKNGEKLEINLKYLLEFVQGYENLNTTFVLVPNSYAVLKDKVPTGLGNIDQKHELEKIYAMISEYAGTLDLYSTLSLHDEEEIYYKTDHHWTTLGAYYAYEVFCESQGLTPIDLDNLKENKVHGFLGTSYSKAKKFDISSDIITYYDIPTTKVLINGKEVDGLYDLDKLDVRDKYGMFLYSNNGIMSIKSENYVSINDEKKNRILVIKDSFANSLIPFLTYNYDEIIVIDFRYFNQSLSELINNYKFDEVLLLYNYINFSEDGYLAKLRY